MKKIVSLLLVCLILLNLGGCKQSEVDYGRDVDYPTLIDTLGEEAIAIHYKRSDETYVNWALWLWNPEGEDDSLEDSFNYQDDFGVVALYPLSHFNDGSFERLGIIIKSAGSWNKKDGTDADRFIYFDKCELDDNGIYHVYFVSDDPNIYYNKELKIEAAINNCYFSNENTIRIKCSSDVTSYSIYEDDNIIAQDSNYDGNDITCSIKDFTVDFSKQYRTTVVFKTGEELASDVGLSGLYNTEAFNQMYAYDGELGAIYSKDKTSFYVWSPVSSSIELRLYQTGTPTQIYEECVKNTADEKLEGSLGSDEYEAYQMNKTDKGVFKVDVVGDLDGMYYTYFVINAKYPEGKEIVDPYAKACGVNGLRGMIIDFSKLDYLDIKTPDYDRKSLTVYETHVADITSSDTWNGSKENKRKYLGLVESGTTYTEAGITVTTGFDHIKELGVNAIQLLPIFDQDNDETSYEFNWGYNPHNYNCLEGLYSSNPYDGYTRIIEFKEMMKELNDENIAVIMDVVYNHVSRAEGSNFDVLMPGYYYRYTYNGLLSNGSGCGNETASEHYMMSRFIVDSTEFLMKEYGFIGYRFDLMGLHDIETMNEVTSNLKKINENAVIYGEPWTGGTSELMSKDSAIQENGNKFIGYGQFNDQLRDALIKGGLSAASELGFVTNTSSSVGPGEINAIIAGINGSTKSLAYEIDDPNKTVNYVTCHDNYTLYDRIVAAGINDEDTIRKMCVLANSIIFTSKGTCFMLGGEEFLRSKDGDSNSYKSSDSINGFDYSLKIKNLDVFENYKKLINFKQNTNTLCSNDDINVELLDNNGVIKATFTSDNKEYLIIHSNGLKTSTSIDVTGYTLYLDTLNKLVDVKGTINIEPYQTLILYK